MAKELAQAINLRKKDDDTLIALCIGTDKITGDCLGPLVGTKLRERGYTHPVCGTLQHPVHAVNLSATLASIRRHYSRPFLLVIDAAVGPADKIGCISFSYSPILSGSGHPPAAAAGGQSVSDGHHRRGFGALRRRPALHETFCGEYTGGIYLRGGDELRKIDDSLNS